MKDSIGLERKFYSYLDFFFLWSRNVPRHPTHTLFSASPPVTLLSALGSRGPYRVAKLLRDGASFFYIFIILHGSYPNVQTATCH